MTHCRRLALTTLVALFIALGTTASSSAASRPVQPDRYNFDMPWKCQWK